MSAEELRLIIDGAILLVLLVGVVIVLFRQGVDAADARFTDVLVDAGKNRDLMDKWEARYQAQDERYDRLFNTVLSVLEIVAPLTPIRSDDALVDVLKDIQTPGAPDTSDAGDDKLEVVG